MKRVIISLLFCLVTIYLYGQDFYMYVDGQKRTFEVSATKMIVKTETLDVESIKNAMQHTVTGNVKDVYNLNNRLFMVDVQNSGKERLIELQEQWNIREDVIYSSPVFIDETGKEMAGLTNQILIRLKNVADYSLLSKSVSSYQIKDIKLSEFDDRSYLLTLENGTVKNAMQAANELFETGLYEYSEPNLIHFIELTTVDTYFQHQWGLNNTGLSGGTSGIDIRAEQTWGITTGSPNIRVAVLDVGVDLNHPDLVNRIFLPGFDATGNNSGGAPINNTGDFAHGTACSGIVAAQANNNRGIAGVAYDCRILPVRIATTSGNWTLTETQFIVNGINWARQNEADVISMSFRVLTQFITPALDLAITTAATTGRNNNLGCILVAASGNGNNGVGVSTAEYPARHPYVIAVGAIDRKGKRADFSNYGYDLDVVAPGVDIYTTGMQMTSQQAEQFGYTVIDDGQNGVYFTNFTGTSAACPHVAGIAALILSVRPDLSWSQVRTAIESTCQKINEYSPGNTNGYVYANQLFRDNGKWNPYVGYGLVDAYEAVKSVLQSYTIYGPSTVRYVGDVFAMDSKPAPNGLTWTVTGPFSFDPNSSVTTSTSPYLTVYRTGTSSSTGTLTAKVGNLTIATKNISPCFSSISGDNLVCYTGSNPYMISNPPLNLVWTLEGPFSFSSSSSVTSTTAASPTVFKTSAAGDYGYLRARIGSASGTIVTSKILTPCETIIGIDPLCGEFTYTLTSGQANSWDATPYGLYSISQYNSTSAKVKPLTNNTVTPCVLSAEVNGRTTYKTIQACSAYITGPNTICDLAPALYELYGAGADMWNISTSNSPIYVDYGSSSWANVKSTSFYGETATLQALYQGIVVASKPIATCNSTPYISGNPSVCDYGTFYLSGPGSVLGCTYWYIETLTGWFSIYSSTSDNVTVYTSVSGSTGILYAVNPGNFVASINISTCRGAGLPAYLSIYPNPVSDILTIEIDADAAQSLQPERASLNFDVRLYDEQGNLLCQTKTQGGTVEFNVSGLPDGFFYLHVYDGVNSRPVMQQIIIEH